MANVAVIGAGAWGTALAISLHNTERHEISLWSHSSLVLEQIRDHGENLRFLPGFAIPRHIRVTTDLSSAVHGVDVVVTVTPCHAVRDIFKLLRGHLQPAQAVVSATKGIETATGLRVSQVIQDEMGAGCPPVCILSGPSFAQEVAAGQPTAVVLATPAGARELAGNIQKDFASPRLRVYTTDDVAGVEFGGALKNVIAIASGIVAGLELGGNTAAALITRGLAEMTRLAMACGGRPETLAGLAGMGDLVLTATGGLSRNRSVGLALGQGRSLKEIVAGMHGKVAEGIETTRAALELAGRLGVEMPITQQVSDILHHGKPPEQAIRELMGRPGRYE